MAKTNKMKQMANKYVTMGAFLYWLCGILTPLSRIFSFVVSYLQAAGFIVVVQLLLPTF